MERILRGPVVGRKNFLFFGAPWAAHLAEMVWSILATAAANGLNVQTYLCAYVQACADHGGPLTGEALERFLLWRLSEADRQAWSAPLPSVVTSTFRPSTPAPRRRARSWRPLLATVAALRGRDCPKTCGH